MSDFSAPYTPPCPVYRCRRKTHLGGLMCRPHWLLVPDEEWRAVWREWNAGEPTRRYPRAVRQALEATAAAAVLR